MKTSMRLENPLEQSFTMSITMPLSKWIELQKKLGEGWPATELSLAISRLASMARQSFAPEDGEPP